MANDKHWEKHSTDWVNMTHKSRQRKEADGRSLQRTETNLTDLEHEANPKPYKSAPHGRAIPPRSPGGSSGSD